MVNAELLTSENDPPCERAIPARTPEPAASRRPGRLSRILTRWLDCFTSNIVEGYEDETGFHEGIDPRNRTER